MKTITLTKENPTSGEIAKHPNRYIDIDIKSGKVKIKITQANGTSFVLKSIIHGTKIKWDLNDYIKIEFIFDSNDAVVDYKLFP